MLPKFTIEKLKKRTFKIKNILKVLLTLAVWFFVIDFKGIARAFLRDLRGAGISQGGSTITQQLVKKALLGDERTITRKIKEIILTVEVERRFSKDEIFWMYLNQIPYGSNAYGVES